MSFGSPIWPYSPGRLIGAEGMAWELFVGGLGESMNINENLQDIVDVKLQNALIYCILRNRLIDHTSQRRV